MEIINSDSNINKPMERKFKKPQTKSIWRSEIDIWLKKYAEHGVNNEHSCIQNDCGNPGKKLIEYIVERPRKIFGCKASGKVHICSEVNCKESFIIKDGEYKCYFSGNPINDERFLTSEWKKNCIQNLINSSNCSVKNECCDINCIPYFQIISRTKNIYGCSRCVKIHYCMDDKACEPFFSLNHHGCVICSVSGRYITDYESIISFLSSNWIAKFPFGFPESIKKHICSHDCTKNNEIITISEKYNVYACQKSGYIHICHANYKCNNPILTMDGVYVCLFSGRLVDVYLSATSFGTIQEQISFNNKPPDLYSDCYTENDNDEEYEMHMELEQEQILEINDKELIQSSPDETAINKSIILEQVMSDDEKTPLEETVEQPGENAELPPSYLMIKDWEPQNDTIENTNEPFHIINKINSVEKIAPDIEKSSSGISQKEKVSVSALTEKKKKSKSNKNKKLCSTRIADAHNILKTLLWDSKKKETLKTQSLIIANRIAKDEIIKHIKEALITQKRLPIQPQLDNLWYKHYNSQEFLRFCKFDKDKCNYYTTICFMLWKKIASTAYYIQNKPKFHWRQHVVGTIYILKDGYKLNDININLSTLIVKPDEYICKYIAHESLITQIDKKLSKHIITSGKNNIKSAINSIPIQNEKEFYELADQLRSILSPKTI